MKSIHQLYLLAFLYGGLCLVTADLDIVPSNTAAIVGSTVTLRCSQVSLPTQARVLWKEFAYNVGGLTISDGKALNPTHPQASRYSITGTALEYHLEIRDVTLSDGGLYFCEDINGPPTASRGYAELTVLESNPLCEDYVPATGIVAEDGVYTIECEIRFRGNIRPVMTWTGPEPYGIENSTPATSTWSLLRFTAHRAMEGEKYICKTNFTTLLSAPPNYATNAPVYEYHHNSEELYIVWGPNNIYISPIQPFYSVGDRLTCNADCKPICRYVWTSLRTQEELDGETYTVTPDMEGFLQTLWCRASVQVAGVIRNNDAFVDVNVPVVTTPTTPGTTPPTTLPPPDGPCTDVTGRWSSLNPDATACIEVDTSGNLQTLIRNGSDLFFVTGNGKTVYDDYKHIGFTGIWPINSAVGGFTGECHRCNGVEVIFLSGLFRNKLQSTQCGTSAGTQLTNVYVMTRSGPPCRGQTLEVYDTKPGQLKRMGIKAKGEMFPILD